MRKLQLIQKDSENSWVKCCGLEAPKMMLSSPNLPLQANLKAFVPLFPLKEHLVPFMFLTQNSQRYVDLTVTDFRGNKDTHYWKFQYKYVVSKEEKDNVNAILCAAN